MPQPFDSDVLVDEKLTVPIEDLLRYDYKRLTDIAKYILLDACAGFQVTQKEIETKQLKLEGLEAKTKEHSELKLKIDNEVKLLTIKVVSMVKLIEKVLYTLNIICKYGVYPYYDYFDSVAYFLTKFKNFIDVGLFTELTFMLLKKNSSRRNEDLLYLYR